MILSKYIIEDFVFEKYALGVYNKFARFSITKQKLLNSNQGAIITEKDWEISKMSDWVVSNWVAMSLYIDWDNMPENVKTNLKFKKYDKSEFEMRFVDVVSDWLKLYYAHTENPIILDLYEVAISIGKNFHQPQDKDYQKFLYEINSQVTKKIGLLDTYRYNIN